MTPEASLERSLSRLPERFEARGEKRGTVALLQGCVQRVFFGHVNEATARVLAAEGFEVHVPRLPRCCGALPLHAGEDPDARDARQGDDRGAGATTSTVVVNAAGCGSAMKDYGHVLRDEPDWAERAARFSARVRDGHEFLAEAGPRAERRPGRAEGRLPRRLPPGPRPGRARRSRASCCAAIPGPGAGRAARVGALLRLGRDLQPGASPSPRPSWASARRATCSTPAPRRWPPATRAARCRSPRTPSASAGRCRCCTRWSCWPARSADPG